MIVTRVGFSKFFWMRARAKKSSGWISEKIQGRSGFRRFLGSGQKSWEFRMTHDILGPTEKINFYPPKFSTNSKIFKKTFLPLVKSPSICRNRIGYSAKPFNISIGPYIYCRFLISIIVSKSACQNFGFCW